MPQPQDIDARRRSVVALALAASGAPGLAGHAAARSIGDLVLSAPAHEGGMPLRQALLRRRSGRRFGPQPLQLQDLSPLLWAAQGISVADGRRTAPSAGACYPIELHLVVARVDGLQAGVYRYLPDAHALRRSIADPIGASLQRAAAGQGAVGEAAAVVALTAVASRTTTRYGARTGRFVAFEAGAASQNLALQAAALGLGAVVIGAFDDEAVSLVLRLPAGEQPVVLMPIGVPP